MNRAILGLGCAVACLALVYGCAERVAGGTTETDNMVSARIYSVDSLLASGDVPVGGATIVTLRLHAGNLDFDSISREGVDLRVETLGNVPLPFRIVFWDRTASLGRIQVRLEPHLQRPGSRIRLRWDLTDSTRSDSAVVWKGIGDSRRLALTSVLVSDFEQGSLLSLLPTPTPWYTNAGDSAIVSAPSIVQAASGRAGQALHFTFTAPIKKTFSLAGVALGERAYNLRSLDSIEVWARGTNTILTVAFDHQGATNKKAWTPVYPDSTWKRFTLRPSDLDSASPNGGNVGWLGVRDSVTHLSFFAAQGSELWLDDIRLYGIDVGDLR